MWNQSSFSCRFSLARVVVPLLVLFTGALAESAPAQNHRPESLSSERLTLERLYSQPNLIGTAPSGVVWSPSGRYLAFAWNEQGEAFRDVYLVDTRDDGLRPQRLTRLPRAESDLRDAEVQEDEAVLRIAREERRRLEPGVRELMFVPPMVPSDELPAILFELRGDLYIVESGSTPVRLLETAEPERAAAVSPDGRWLAFLRSNELQVATLRRSPDTASPSWRLGQVQSIESAEEVPESSGVTSFRWSPDSQRISVVETDRSHVVVRDIPDYLTAETSADRVRRAYPGEEPERSRLGLAELTAANGGGEAFGPIRFVDLGPTEEASPEIGYLLSHRWSPDGQSIAVDVSDLYVKHRRILRVNALRGVASLWLEEVNPSAVSPYFWRIEWADDGSGLYVISDFLGPQPSSDYHLFFATVGGEVEEVTSGDFAVAEIQPIPGGVVVVSNRGSAEERHVSSITRSGRAAGTMRQLTTMPGTHQPMVSPDGRFVATLHSSDAAPPDLFLLSIEDSRTSAEARRITDSPLDEFDAYDWQTPRYVTFESRVDGATLHGRLTLPPDHDPSRRYPAILGSVYTDAVRNQWGGRTAHPTWGLDQYLAQQGYVLLNVDMRGSWGRGREFREGIRLSYGGPDVDDLASAVDFLATLGYVDMERVGMWGSSYGGLMTAMSLFRYPELYAAGVAAAPATNVWHALTGQMAVMMDPADEPDRYAASSPYLHASGLEDPLMIIHGMRDRVVLFKDSVRLVQNLIQLEKDVELVALPDGYHGWDLRPDAQTRFALRKLVDFFDRHLEPGQADRQP